MTDQLETELRAALRERAAQIPTASIARLTHLDYHPRTRRLRPPVAIGALATAAGTAGAVAVVISLSAGASNAFAGWTPTPTRPAPDQLAAASADCQTQSPVAGLPLKLADTRGPFTFAVYADANSSATCIKGPSFTSVSSNTTSAPIDVPAGHIFLSSSHATNSGGAYSFADGRSGAGVIAVTLVLDDGTNVQATVANGWFVAWWPGASNVKSADITTPAGTTNQTFDLGHASPCGAVPCAGNASGSGGGSASGSGGGGASAVGGGGPLSASGSSSVVGPAAGNAPHQRSAFGTQTYGLSQ
jgi:hypothetical protein